VSEVGAAPSFGAEAALGRGVGGRVDALAPNDCPHPTRSIDTVRAMARHPNFLNVCSCFDVGFRFPVAITISRPVPGRTAGRTADELKSDEPPEHGRQCHRRPRPSVEVSCRPMERVP